MPRSSYVPKIREILAARPDEPAIDFDGRLFTWREAQAVAVAVEELLDELGVPEFGRVGLMGRSRPVHFALLWGLFVAGRCTAMVHAFQPPAALAEDVATHRWPVLFGEKRDWTAEVVAAADAAGTAGYALTDDAFAPFVRVTLRAEPAADLLAAPADDTIIQLLSSGTTGKPKPIYLSLHSIDELIERTRFQFVSGGAGESAPQIVPWPLSSLGGTNAALPAVTLGQLVVIQEKFDAPRFLEQLRKYRPSFLSMPPAAMAMLLQLKPAREDLASVKLYFNGAAPLDPNVRTVMEEEYGLPVANAYGATEFAGIISSWVPEDFALLKAKRGSCGRALPGMKLRIVSQEDGTALPAGEVGLVEALVPRVSDDWIRTNDLAYLDEDGFLFLEGRADDAIIRGGFKVIPEEIAEVLRTHPKVGDAALIGIPDERLGMVPAAVVEKRLEGDAPTPDELDAFLRSRLAAYKLPVRYAVVPAIPRTASMKPRREGLRALFA
ncbi:MAG: long-chain fatty acid--CoA ligase [Sphingomonadales bacterium]|nr:long-chain fatty acid--CoA ligase [Sphingomonadales bacterium]